MIKNYFKIAYRNLINKKGYLIINVGGLGIGMMCCLLIFQFVAFEYSFDKFHENGRDIYRVLQQQSRPGDKVDLGHGYTAQAFAPALKESVGEIVEITRLHDEEAVVINREQPSKVFESNSILYADPGFLKMFSFPLSSGTLDNALTPGTAFISESASLQYFGTLDATGKVLEVTGQLTQSYTISGVLKNVPSNSHLQFDVLLPMQVLLQGEDYSKEPEGGWSWNNFATYIQVHPNADLNVVEKKMIDVYLRYRGDALKKDGSVAVVHAQPLSDVHLNGQVQGAIRSATGSYRTVYFFMVVGII